MRIEPEQIKDVIGPGGKNINEIIEKSNDVKIDIEQDGRVTIYHFDQEAIHTAAKLIENIVKKAEVGEVYDGKVVRVEDKFAFVELFEGTNGFLHVGDVAHERINKVSDVLKVGEDVYKRQGLCFKRLSICTNQPNFVSGKSCYNKESRCVLA